MALGQTLNAIDAARQTQDTARQQLDTARTSLRSARQDEQSNAANLEADIRDANTNGVGPIAAGFLDAVLAGETKEFEWSNSTRRLTFTYIKDSDAITNIVYETRNVNQSTL